MVLCMHRIRRAMPADATWITALWNALIRDTAMTFTSVEKTETGIAALISSQPMLVLGSSDGFATYGGFRKGPGYRHTAEHTIVLAPAAQRQGGGRALLAALEDAALAEAIHVMVAGIAANNAPARAFHAACGYTEVAFMPEVGQKFGEWQDLVLMQKVL